MRLITTKKEDAEILTTALQYFAESLRMWEFEYNHNSIEYNKAKLKLIKQYSSGGVSLCQEDILAQTILEGKGIELIDENDSENIIIFNIKLFNDNFDKCDPMDILKLLDKNGDYDFYTTDAVLQCLIFGKVTYG